MKLLLLNLISTLIFAHTTYAQKNVINDILKPRIVVLTDVSPWETDDQESLVRLLSYADMFEIEGIIYSTGWNHDTIPDECINIIYNVIDAYEKDLPNLMKRSNQMKHKLDKKKSKDRLLAKFRIYKRAYILW